MWSSTSILLAALITGTLLSLLTQDLGLMYLGCFTLGALITVLMVEPRGLFLTAAQIPFLFGVATPLAALVITGAQSPTRGDGKLSKTELITLIFPLAQFFPTLIAVSVGAVIIAVVRYVKHKNNNVRLARRQSAQRKRDSRSDRSNLSTATRARRAASRTSRYRDERSRDQVTVDELLRRSQLSQRASSASSRQETHQRNPESQRDTQRPRLQGPHSHDQRSRPVSGTNQSTDVPHYGHNSRRGWDDGDIRSPRVPRRDGTRRPSTPASPRRETSDRTHTSRRDIHYREPRRTNVTRRDEPASQSGRNRNTEGRARQSQTHNRITSSIPANHYEQSSSQTTRPQGSRGYGDRRRDNRFLHQERTSRRDNNPRR